MSPDFSEDRLLGGRVLLRQPRQGYRAAIDPVLLAASLDPKPGQHVLDIGCGVGAAALCLLARRPDITITGIEIQPGLAELARQNAALNGVADRFQIIEGDIAALRLAERFDHAMSNPPFLPPDRGNAPPDASKALAHVEDEADLPAWTHFAATALPHRGTLTLIHRADRLTELLAALEDARFGSVVIFPLWPRTGTPAKRVLVRAAKGGKAPLVLSPGLLLHGADGGFTPAAEAILRDAAALTLG
ncbi:tRNA1(Val) (adenine(37)-N6)-methyltransferase [Oceanibaculum indicum]|uniref:tRNA1(Val) A37 N6-methylase TrmN6 n=1 Tax=Oceanibaculum indicum TaxID=526216 RepID=A0A420WGM7_9PROT|nr:methyltransferase [Oceanibaculum indicum]RKQ70095.1 tRNA1(Val) A37 N6-methylase TrmN6 [Oceanibaculum indicum]